MDATNTNAGVTGPDETDAIVEVVGINGAVIDQGQEDVDMVFDARNSNIRTLDGRCLVNKYSGLKNEANGGHGFSVNSNMHFNKFNSLRTNENALDSDAYDFSHTKRGYAVIVVNSDFPDAKHKRNGANLDFDNFRFIANRLGFCILNEGNELNLPRLETLELLIRARQVDHSNNDCFAMFISTHGLVESNARAQRRLEHALVCADGQLLFTRDVLDMFSDRNCPSLKDKPKLFFIQACRGTGLDDGVCIKVEPNPPVLGRKYLRQLDSTSHGIKLTQIDGSSSNNQSYNPRSHADNEYRSRQCHTDSNREPSPNQSQAIILNEDRLSQSNTDIVKQTSPNIHGSSSLDQAGHTTDKEATQCQLQPVSETVACLEQSETDRINSATSRAIINMYAPQTPVLQCGPDMLVMYAIPDGMQAWRSPDIGSWMINDLYEVIKKSYDMNEPKQFLSLLTKVAAKMSVRKSNTKDSKSDKKKVIPVIVHKLVKDILFTYAK